MIDCQTYYFADDGLIPNNPQLPLLVYSRALRVDRLSSAACREMLSDHGWSNSWINGIYSYHHYHSNTHEVLVVIEGSASVMMGGKRGEKLSISRGDAVVIPAGVGHCHLSSTADFKVMGAYPGGSGYDLCTGKTGERPEVIQNIREVPIPEMDPVTGEKAPLHRYWE